MPFKKGNQLGSHKNHKANFKPEIFIGTRWMMQNGKTERVAEAEVDSWLAKGWVLGRPKPSEETRRKQSAAHWGKDNPGAFKKGHQTWNRGDKMPEYAGINMSAAHLAKYDVTAEQIAEARSKDMSWCSHHRQFEPNAIFHVLKTGRRASRCNACHNKHTPWYKAQFKKQGGVCGICGEPEPRLDALCVDHHHDCPDPRHTRKHEPRIGCICTRGLLCSLCNMKFGYFESFVITLIDPQFAAGSWEQKCVDYLACYPVKSMPEPQNENCLPRNKEART